MKKSNKTIKVIGFTTIVLILFSFAIVQLTQEKDLIIGIWIPEGSPNSKWEFKKDGKCFDYYEGNLENTYSWYIYEEKSVNGKLTFSFLKLINVNDSNDVYEYEINGLNENELYLDYLGDKNTKLLHYTKQ